MRKMDTETDALIASMQKSVTNALDRKQRLGQYAVVWENGGIVRLDPEGIKPSAVAETQ